MPVVEDLGKFPKPMSAQDEAKMVNLFNTHHVNFVDPVRISPGGGGVFKLWPSREHRMGPHYDMFCADLLAYEPSVELTKLEDSRCSMLHVRQPGHDGRPGRLITMIPPRVFRFEVYLHSGGVTVAQGGYVFPRTEGSQLAIGMRAARAPYDHDMLLRQINKGEESRLCIDRWPGWFMRVDSVLEGEKVEYLRLRTALGIEDAVILHKGKLIDRERVFPFLTEPLADDDSTAAMVSGTVRDCLDPYYMSQEWLEAVI